MDENFHELLEALDREGANYLITGGYAIGAHGHMRATKDLDILIATSVKSSWPSYARL